MLKKIFLRLRTKLYFLPLVYSLLSILLAFLVIYLDYSASSFYAIGFLYTSRELGSVILSTVVGCLLSMLTITFSIMMVVLTIYGSQMSPRSLQDFLEKKTTLRILGYFIASLVFTIISLFAVKSRQYENHLLSPAIGIFLFICAVILFAYFIHYISKSVQITHYIHTLSADIAAMIESKQKKSGKHPAVRRELPEEPEKDRPDGFEISARKSGFIQYYDEEKLLAFAEENNVVISTIHMTGTHVMDGDPLLRIFELQKNADDLKDIEDRLLELVYIGDEPNLYEDILAGIKKLVEIAVKALSPGINDPNTAVFCIQQIGFLLQKAAMGLEGKRYADDQNKPRLFLQGLRFDQLLFHHFYQITQYGMKDITIIDAVLSALIMICKNNSYSVKKQVWSFSRYIFEKVAVDQSIEYEKKYLKERFYQLSQASNQTVDFNQMFSGT
jgi:uncharacterized membrane protein